MQGEENFPCVKVKGFGRQLGAAGGETPLLQVIMMLCCTQASLWRELIPQIISFWVCIAASPRRHRRDRFQRTF